MTFTESSRISRAPSLVSSLPFRYSQLLHHQSPLICLKTSHCFRSAWRRCSPCTHSAARGKAELIQIKKCHLFGRNISSSLLIVTDGNGAGAANTLRLCDWVGSCRWRFKGCWLFMILERIQSPSTTKKTVHLHLEGCRQGLTLLKVII